MTIQEAADEIACDGGILYFPPGVWPFTSAVNLASNIWVLGAGSASVLTRDDGGEIFVGDGVSGVRVSNLRFEINGDTENVGTSALLFTDAGDPCTDIVIEHCVFVNTAGTPGDYAYAITLDGVKLATIRENVVRGLDIAAGGNCSDLFIQSNHIADAPRFAIGIDVAAEGTATNCIIEGNLIESPANMGIFVGASAENVLGAQIASVSVRGNIVTGEFHEAAGAIFLRPAEVTTDIVIDGNIVANLSESAAANCYGIMAQEGASGAEIRSLTIRGNTISNLDQSAIAIIGTGRSIIVSSNIIDTSRGVQIYSIGGLGPILVVENIINNCALQGLLVNAYQDDLGGAVIVGNVITDTFSGTCAAIRLVAAEGFGLGAEVRGNRCTSPSQTNGVKEEGAGDFKTRYLQNDFGSTSPALDINSAAPVEDNEGVTTESRGVATIDEATNIITPTHGLTYQPTLADISLTLIAPPTTWTTNNIGQIWAELDDLTYPGKIVIRCAPAPGWGEEVQVAWQAKVRGA